jgi:hypothetical protein
LFVSVRKISKNPADTQENRPSFSEKPIIRLSAPFFTRTLFNKLQGEYPALSPKNKF